MKPTKKRFYWGSLLLLLICLHTAVAPASASAQANKPQTVLVSFKDKKLSHILDYITTHTTYVVSYGQEVRNYSRAYTVSFEGAAAPEAIRQLLQGTPFSFNVEGNVISVRRSSATTTTATTATATSQPPATQNRVITGVVRDTQKEPLAGVTVKVKGTNKGGITDMNGQFRITVDQPTVTLEMTCVGFAPLTAQAKAGTAVEVTMGETATALQEVSVVAYGQRNTREIVGAISSIKGEKLQDVPNPSLETLLQGQLAGVEVSNISGSPGGGGSQVVIRGFSSLNQAGADDTSPLYVIDGVPVKAGTSEQTGGINLLATLDPSSIESVEVLKDAASAALYGSRAANGVILITTKKGKVGKTQFGVNVSQSVTYLPETPIQTVGSAERRFRLRQAIAQVQGYTNWDTYETVIPKEYADTWGLSETNGEFDFLWNNGRVPTGNKVGLIAQDSLNTFYNNSTNWWKYNFRVGYLTNANLYASGGTENFRYMLGGGMYNEKGIMIGSSFTRGTFYTNLDLRLTPKLNTYARINLAYTDRTAGADMGKIQGLTVDPKATSSMLPGKGSIAEEEAQKRLLAVSQKNGNYNVRLNLGADYSPIKGLKFTSTAAVDHYLNRLNIFYPDFLDPLEKKSKTQLLASGMTMMQSENYANYTFDINKQHNFDLMAGLSFNRDVTEVYTGEAKGGPSNKVHFAKGDNWPKEYLDNQGNTKHAQEYTSDYLEQNMMSYYGRVAYNYEKKYLAEATLRRDGSSVFGREVRWATFPSVALGWAFSEEKMAKDWWWMSFGKLRASWGRSGQKFDDPYLALGLLEVAGQFLGNPAFTPSILSNNQLTWQQSDQWNIGADLHLWDYRFKLAVDYYYKYSSRLLMESLLPGNFYFKDKVWSNKSAIVNTGLEVDITADIFREKPFDWRMRFNFSYNDNMFVKSPDGTDLPDKVLGRPIYGIYTYKDEGIVQSENEIPYYYDATGTRRPLDYGNETSPLMVGARKIGDLNNDGHITNSDLYYAGSTIPLAYGGWTNELSWKGLTLNVLMNYSLARKVMNMVTGSTLLFDGRFDRPIMDDLSALSFWEKPGDQTDYPHIRFSGSGYKGQYDGDIDSRIENVSFLRLKQLTLGYTIPEKYTKTIGLKTARLFLSGENLFLLTNYSGLDPEIINPYTGKDIGDSYPLNRKWTLGINLTF